MKIINLFILITLLYNTNLLSGEPKSVSYITGVGSTHFEAHRMAMNMANISRTKITGQLSQKSNDGLWHVILKVYNK
jgi:hypothetical protein